MFFLLIGGNANAAQFGEVEFQRVKFVFREVKIDLDATGPVFRVVFAIIGAIEKLMRSVEEEMRGAKAVNKKATA